MMKTHIIDKDMEMNKDSFSNINGQYIIETDNIKFPTFADDFVEEQIRYITPIRKNKDSDTDNNNHNEALKLNLQSLYENLGTFTHKYDSLFKANYPHSQLLKNSFIKHKMNYLELRIHFIFFNRQIELFYILFFNQGNQKEDSGYTNLNQHRTKDSASAIDLANEFIKTHSYYNYIANSNANDNDNSQDSQFKSTVLQLFTSNLTIEDSIYKMIFNLGPDYYPSTSTFTVAMTFILGIMKNLYTDTKIFKGLIDFSSIEDNELIGFYNNLHQLDVCCEVFYNFYRVSSKDIFNQDETGPEWSLMKEHYSRIVLFSKDLLKKKMEKVIELVNVGYASVSKVNEKYDSSLMMTLGAGAYMTYYFFNAKKAKTQSMKFLIHPDTKISQMIWNMLDVKGIKTAYKIVLPHIKYSKKWFVKRLEPEITLKDLNEIEERILKEDYAINHNRLYPQIQQQQQSQNTTNANGNNASTILELFEANDSHSNDINSIIESIEKSNKALLSQYVRIKIVHNHEFIIKNEKRFFDFINNCSIPMNKKPINNNTNNALIIHIHGGGFIAMSSSSHENYTRKWANRLNVPLIGIDYSLSPDHPFPKALDDVYQAYIWLITNAETMFSMKLNTIILVGDSAGGNIALALAHLLIVKEKRIPNAVFLAYPALKLCLEELSLSYMNSLNDPVLEFNLLKFCLESYSKDCPNGHDPFMSPLFMNDKVMKYLPAVRIYSGSSDPLRDDSVLLLKRLVDLKKDVLMREFKYFPHGFLSYDNQMMLSEASKVNDIIMKDMDYFLLKQ